MPINHWDGRFALDLWEDPESEEAPDHSEYGDTEEEMRQRAEVIIGAGRFKLVQLHRWDNGDWTLLDEIIAETSKPKPKPKPKLKPKLKPRLRSKPNPKPRRAG